MVIDQSRTQDGIECLTSTVSQCTLAINTILSPVDKGCYRENSTNLHRAKIQHLGSTSWWDEVDSTPWTVSGGGRDQEWLGEHLTVDRTTLCCQIKKETISWNIYEEKQFYF